MYASRKFHVYLDDGVSCMFHVCFMYVSCMVFHVYLDDEGIADLWSPLKSVQSLCLAAALHMAYLVLRSCMCC